MKKERGILFVLSGPSGVGKGTVNRALRQQWNELEYSISVTTRKPRDGEKDGVDYFFKSRKAFEKMIEQNQLLEWAEYVGNYYGTPLQYVEECLQDGKDVMLEIEVQGALQVRNLVPEGVFIFLAPPSLDELRNRIVGRGTETDDSIENRMLVAREELEMMDHYDYVVENDEIQAACDRIKAISIAEHCKKDRMKQQYLRLLEAE